MTRESAPSISRLAAANPAAVDEERGCSPEARAILAQILASERSIAGQAPRVSPAPRAPRRPSRRLALVLVAVLLLAAGAALAATDPFGFWRSSSPGTAMFAVDPGRHVRTPTAQQIACAAPSAGLFHCGTRLTGQRYQFIDRIQAVNLGLFSRATVQRALLHAVASGQISQTTARRIEADFAQVSDSFFTHMQYLLRFTTFGSSLVADGHSQLVPPPGVPALVVCEPAGSAISCRDLNGDESVAIGSGVYGALPGRDWVRTRVRQPAYQGDRLIEQVFGRPLTAAERRVMIDLVTSVSPQTTSTASSSHSAPVARRGVRRK